MACSRLHHIQNCTDEGGKRQPLLQPLRTTSPPPFYVG
ncbi:MAG: hypothetical protein OZSIB_2586 [Candidatus Ozemobacter sibiricus]|uniref:Uncharacterized protein n=1 Tax=Candidatus Ozemobacter sibiricus TaxID=2268124 RepID=A0A367ZIZ2_9BACT|nr:MAG: hypothetical protein OZSIB_2586 [Candidatus Ozemobacter sibiricus]